MILLPAAFCADYREKAAGDEAYRHNDYSSAASFYGKYLEKARAAGDVAAEKDAYERRIDSLVLGQFPEQAEKLLNEYKKKFTGSDPIAVTIWTADILMMQNKPEDARNLIERILNDCFHRILRPTSSVQAVENWKDCMWPIGKK